MERIDSLKRIAEETLAACRVERLCRFYGDERKLPVFLPGGDGKYGSFWVRDTSMCALCGLMPDEDLKRYVEYMALCGQNGAETLRLEHGLIVPPWTLADHINDNGRPVFYPGTYADGDDQGNGRYGFLPPLDDSYWFILAVAQYVHQSGDCVILAADYAGLTLSERLEKAFDSGETDAATGLCRTDKAFYAVDWGFCDCVQKGGLLLMPSLLRRQAALALAELGFSETYRETAARIGKSLIENLYDEDSGWFFSASEVCRQHDVWATALAAASGVLSGERLDRTCAALLEAYESGKAVSQGYVRQLLTSERPHWETLDNDGYQSGGYWATPTGWYVSALRRKHPDAADRLLDDFIAHTAAHEGTPYEWMSADGAEFSGRFYGTSAALPYVSALEFVKN